MNANVIKGLEAYRSRYNKLRQKGKTPAEAREEARINKRPKTKRENGRYKYSDDELYERFIKVQNGLVYCRQKRREAINQLKNCEEEERELTNLSRQIDRRENKPVKIDFEIMPEKDLRKKPVAKKKATPAQLAALKKGREKLAKNNK